MHILHCYKTAMPLTMGGVEQVIHHLAKGSVEKGHRVTVLCFSSIKNTPLMHFEGYEICVIPATKEFFSMPLSISGFSQFKKLSQEVDIVHYHYPFPLMDLMHFIHPHQTPCLLTYHSDIVKQKYLSQIYRPLQQYFLKKMSSIVTTSPNYFKGSRTLQKYESKVTCIPLGLDENDYQIQDEMKLEQWRQQLPERFLLFIGVFRYYKGLEFLFEAMKGLNYPLVLIGRGEQKEKLEYLKQKYHLTNVMFLGGVNNQDKNMILSLSSGLILPSLMRSEAFGLSLVEGAMFGKPLISCDISTGTSYINQDKKTGWVVQPGNIASLRKALMDWFTEPELAHTYGQQAKMRFNTHFKSSKMVNDYIHLYEKLRLKKGKR